MSDSDRDAAYRAFTTTVGLITTDGSRGPNVMAAEWTFHVSYEPFLVMVLVNPETATHGAIRETREFGVNLVSDEQVAAMGFAGHFSKDETDKLSSALFPTYPGRRIGAPMIRGALLNAECRLVKEVALGDHTAFVGEVVEFSVDPTKRPVVLHRGAHHLGPRIERTPSVAVAVTPMVATPGASIAFEGELAGPERARAAVDLSILGPEGRVVARARPTSDGFGSFRADVDLPKDLPAGSYGVEAKVHGAVGRATLEVRT